MASKSNAKKSEDIKVSAKGIKLFSWIFVILLGVGYTAYDVFIAYPKKKGSGVGDQVSIKIEKGSGPAKIASVLNENGLIESSGKFKLWLRYSNELPSINAGTFVVNDSMSPLQIIRVLQGKSISNGVRVVIPEGFKLSQIGKLLEKRGLVSSDDFRNAAFDSELLKKANISAKSFEGYLFPDTYFFEKETSAIIIIDKMHKNFVNHLNNMEIEQDDKLHEIVTLASIVQSEARVDSEAKIIAGVYINRLNEKLFPTLILQADPTVAYGCDKYQTDRPISCNTFKGRLGHKQLFDSNNKYNTYKNKGLPPGPISAPGKTSLLAAADPQKHNYLYFVVSSKGKHKFSKTYKEHVQAVKAYRKKQ